jgi:hypothetical protein
MEDEAKLDAALSGLPSEVKKQVLDLRTTLQILKIQKVPARFWPANRIL